MGIADFTPNALASYEQVETTPRPDPACGSAPTTTGFLAILGVIVHLDGCIEAVHVGMQDDPRNFGIP